MSVWIVATNLHERRRQKLIARSRPVMATDEFVAAMAMDGVPADLARFLHDELRSYYVAPLTPFPTDRIYGDLKIDPEDIGEIGLRFERRFGRWLGEGPLDCPADPTIADLGLVLTRA